jgi:hypothetical protein
MSELSVYLTAQKKLFLVGMKETGGRAKGFRHHIGQQYSDDREFFNKLVLDALMEAATKKWEEQPRKQGPDLFSINGHPIPEYLTRAAFPVFDDPDEEGVDEEAEQFEKVDHQFATVNDLVADATIKLRKAAQSGAAAEDEMKAADVARRRARGNMTAYLRDLADVSGNEDDPEE